MRMDVWVCTRCGHRIEVNEHSPAPKACPACAKALGEHWGMVLFGWYDIDVVTGEKSELVQVYGKKKDEEKKDE